MTGRVATIPNLLTAARGLAAIPVVTAILNGWFVTAIVVVVAAGLTDGLDGLLARRTGQTSDLGRLLDPIADKVLLVAAFVAASVPGRGFEPLPMWLVALAILRDVGIVVAGFGIYVVTGFSGFRPTLLGKINTVLELVVIGLFLLTRAAGLSEGLLTTSIYLTAGSIVASGFHYVWYARRQLAEAGRKVGVGTA